MKSVYDQIKDFILKNKDAFLPQSNWFYPEGIDVYLRVGKMRVASDILNVVTVSNIANAQSVPSTGLNQQGYFKELLIFLENQIKDLPEIKGIYFENVSSPRLVAILTKHNYVIVGTAFEGIHCWYKQKELTNVNTK